MKRDHGLFLIIGALAGFIAGYMTQDSVSGRLPPASGGAPHGVATGTASAGGGAAMADEVSQLRAHLETNPDDADAVLRLANLNYDIQRWEGARDLYARYLELRPGDSDVLTDLGVCYRQLGAFEEALGFFEEAIAASPDHWQARFNQVIVLAFDQGHLERAASVLSELRELQPGNPDVERLAAEVERRLGAA